MPSESWTMQRAEPRATVLPVEVRGLITWQRAGAQQLPFLLWDIAVNGMGLILSEELTTGELVQLSFGHPYSLAIDCKVCWCTRLEADYDFQEPSYRAGVEVNQQGAKVQQLVDQINHLRKK